MTKVIIDEIEYDSENMSDDAKAQLKALQFVSDELNRLQLQSAALQTARHAYANALKGLIGEEPDEALDEAGAGGLVSFEGVDDE